MKKEDKDIAEIGKFLYGISILAILYVFILVILIFLKI